MSGARSRTFRLGDRSEFLVEHLLAGVAFSTRVPRQEDIGIDFMCSLITGSHRASPRAEGSGGKRNRPLVKSSGHSSAVFNYHRQAMTSEI